MMYETFYQLRERPFDPAVCLLTGAAGAGKSLYLQLILVSQRVLRGEIRSPGLLRLAGLVAANSDLGELAAVDTRRYIDHRLRVTGAAAGAEVVKTRMMNHVIQERRTGLALAS